MQCNFANLLASSVISTVEEVVNEVDKKDLVPIETFHKNKSIRVSSMNNCTRVV